MNVGEYRGLHPLADKDQSKHHHPSPSLCTELHPEPLCAHFIVALLSREVGDCFLTWLGNFS